MSSAYISWFWRNSEVLWHVRQVHDATSKLSTSPASPEDFADLLDFLEKLEQRRHGLDETYDHVGLADSLSQQSSCFIAMCAWQISSMVVCKCTWQVQDDPAEAWPTIDLILRTEFS